MDIAILDAVQAARTPFLDTVMPLATHLGDLGLIWLVIAAVLAAQPRYRRWGIAVAVALAATVVVGVLILKPLFGRPRPFVELGFTGLLIPPPGGSSFPSNHSMASFAAATALCWLPGKGAGVRALKASGIVIALLIAISRVYLYVHYPSDILAGAVIGVGLGCAVGAAAKRLRPDDPPGAASQGEIDSNRRIG